MRMNTLKAIIKTAARGAAVLLCGAGLAAAQSVNLTAARTNTTLPDGSLTPMWGYSCGTTVTATCAGLNPNAPATAPFITPATPGWSPVVITVAPGPLTINLTNNLPVPTSLTIVGQLGGGLGVPTPGGVVTHAPQGATWPIAGSPATPASPDDPTFTPPTQGPRVRSFAQEVASGGGNQALTWVNLTPGTYLIESGTHPSIQGPMGLYGILVVTTAPVGTTAGTAYPAVGTIPAVSYNAEVPLLLSEIDKVQNTAVDTAVNTTGFDENTVWTGGPNGCGAHFTCYPPAVNYTPMYYMINGQAFDKTHASNSLFASNPATAVTGNVLVRIVNAGLRMHVPSIVGSQTGTGSVGGFTLIAEDGNPLPGTPRVQSEVFMAAGKTYDVMINAPAAAAKALPIYDRQLSLSGNSSSRDAGMLAYINVNGAVLPGASSGIGNPVANADTYNAVVAGQTISVSDPGKGVIANDINVYGVQLDTANPASGGTVTLDANGTFTWVATAASGSFGYCANGGTTACTTVTMGAATIESASGITCAVPATLPAEFTPNLATFLSVKTPGVLQFCKDAAGYPLTASFSATAGLTGNATGAFTATSSGAGPYSFTFTATNSQGTSSAAIPVTLTFPAGSGLAVTVLDGSDKTTTISDYKWIIEEDRTFYVDPICAANQGSATPVTGHPCPANPVNFGTNFHTSYMPLVAQGCTGPQSCEAGQTMLVDPNAGTHGAAVCDVGGSICRPDSTGNGKTPVDPSQVHLDPHKRYYISVLPGDAAQPFINGYGGAPDCSAAGVAAGSCGHGMGGAPVPAACVITTGNSCTGTFAPVTILTEPSPYPPATLSVFVFEDDYPLNGEHDAGGQIVDTSAAGNEPGLGGFQITLDDSAGGTGDATGTPTYDMFNMPLSNALAGTIDPTNGNDACPISTQDTADGQGGIVGMIVTCPYMESDGVTVSPLGGQAIVKNLYQGRYGVIANPGADRIARGEEWLQTNTLDGQKAHDSFMRIGEPGYFQEFGPAGYHVTIGFANPKIINDRGALLCHSGCSGEVKGHITTGRMSRTPDERLYGSEDHTAYGFTQCYVSMGDPDGEEFLFTKCDDGGNFDFKNVPPGNWKITTFDQWNDQVVDGITTPVVAGSGVTDMGEIGVHQWQADIYTRTFLDVNGDGISNVDANGNPTEPGLALEATNIRFRDGSYSNFNSGDLNGFAGFNEVFPLFNWYVIETDNTRFKNTGTHVVYDSGGPADGTAVCGTGDFSTSATKACGNSVIADHLANTYEPNPLPAPLSLPGSVYCPTADCTGLSVSVAGDISAHKSGPGVSTGRIDGPWVNSYGWQGFSGQTGFLEFGKKPFAPGENGGIHGHVVYASTRPFDDPQLLLQLSWEPLIPHVRVNLYKEGLAADGVTQTLTMIDHTETTSFDDWAQGFRTDATGLNLVTDGSGNYIPNMNCPGQGKTAASSDSLAPDPYFFAALTDQPQWLDLYNNPGATPHALANHSQYKCYDGMHNWNQLQPAPYDGAYYFPSVTAMDPQTGKPTQTNCTGCTTNPDASDPYRFGTPMLPNGKYVVEVVVPQGYELVKEEDKNILIGDNYIAPATQQFGGLGSIFILPDQAEINAYYNANNPGNLNTTGNLGRSPNLPSHEGDTGSDESFWPCVGQARIVPDFISLFPGSSENAPFAGAVRNLCDRKEVALTEQSAVLTKFYLFTSTHAASHFTGVITDDFSAEFDPFSPQFGEKFAPAYLPVSIEDWTGNVTNRVYSDQWGSYNGLSYSTWEVNPPNPTGYGPTTMITCMNDAGPVVDTTPGSPTLGQKITDPLFQPGYSQFCYELPFMPGQTGYFDTPVVPTSAFAGDYNTPDCSYPDATPAVKEVDGDTTGPWIAGLKGTVTAVNVTAGGTGYTGTPTVAITGGGGTGAAGTVVTALSGSVSSVTVGNHGRGYTGAPAVTFTGGGGSGATATAVMNSSASTVAITNGGSYLRALPAPTATISGCTGVTLTVNTSNINTLTRRVSSVTVNNAGTCTGPATITFSLGTPSATGTVTEAQSVASVTVTNGGTGYTTPPTVAFGTAAPSGGVRATGTAVEANVVVAVNLTSGGSGYTSNPSVSITGGGGSGATATASAELTGGSLTITALGDQMVDNYAYSGPTATAATIFGQQKVKRHYGFGGTAGTVTIGGAAATVTSWTDGQIVVNVPSLSSAQNACTLAQQTQYGGSAASCGELVITAANGKQSIDTVTVTIGGKAPTVMAAGQAIQNAIDKAKPGDMIIVPAGTYSEMLLMWKPVRLQGVGAASSIIDANPHPAGKLDPWRRQVVCLFGLALNGTPIQSNSTIPNRTNSPIPFDPSGTFNCSSDMQFSVDRLPLEATVGWDATLNGNLAEQLIEPTIMGAYEGAGITVLGKGVQFPDPSHAFDSDVFPTGTVLLDGSTNTTHGCGANTASAHNPFPSNFLCNPSSIDGLTVKNSSQGGGGIMVHGWNHKIQIANNRVENNQGTLSGGITIGQGEHPDAYLAASIANTIPSSCISDTSLSNSLTNLALPFCFNLGVNVHNNLVVQNSSLGDELFSSTPAGAGGVTFCSGADYYKFNFNWICGNMSTGDGAGAAHMGFSYDGTIEHNTILFNQSTNPTITTNGGGLLVMGAPDQDPPCPGLADVDCVVDPSTILPTDGAGPGLIVNANLIVGNSADAGSGGGLRLQHVNGTDVLNFPRGNSGITWPNVSGFADSRHNFQNSTPWNAVQVTNNIIANNVAGWDGGGVSLQDALATDIINNTIVSNVSTASSGVLFQSLFAPLASEPGTNCYSTFQTGGQSCAQPSGLVSVTNSAVLTANIHLPTQAAVTCPTNHGTSGSCTIYSVPLMYNDLFWQNRSLVVGVGGLSTGTPFTNQQNAVAMYNAAFSTSTASRATSTSAPTPQTATGQCEAAGSGAKYWDIGVRGQAGPGIFGTMPLAPTYSFLTNPTGNFPESTSTTNRLGTDPALGSLGATHTGSLYCNGSRVPPEAAIALQYPGWQVPPGTNESNAVPAPAFTLAPAATVDEGNNWINLRWGPLSLFAVNQQNVPFFTFSADPGVGSQVNGFTKHCTVTQNANCTGTGNAVNAAWNAAPSTDFYGNARKANGANVTTGAVEFTPPNFAVVSVSPTSLTFNTTVVGATSAAQTLTVSNVGGAAFTGLTVGALPAGFARTGTGGTNCGTTLAAGATCTINITYTPSSTTTVNGTVAITGSVAVTGSPVSLSGTGMAATFTATVSPNPLAFGNWATGTTSNPMNVTVTNTGNSALAGGTFVLGGGTPQPFTRVTNGTFPNGAPNCAATLAVGASCTVKVAFAAGATVTSYSRTLTVAYTNAGAVVTGSPVTLTGSAVAAKAAVSIAPNPLTVTINGSAGTVTFTNNAAAGGSSVAVTNVQVAGAGLLWAFTKGTDTCNGTNVAPGASCTVQVNLTGLVLLGPTTGTITFTDSGTTNPVGALN